MAIDTDFEAVFREHYPRLVAIGVALTGDSEIADELAQETMARAHRDWVSVSTATSQVAWLRTVLKNLIVDHYRRRASDDRKTARLAARTTLRPPDSAVEIADADASMTRLLALLPERQRVAVALRYVDDLEVNEIARVLGVATGTAKATLWKARRTLERELRSEGWV